MFGLADELGEEEQALLQGDYYDPYAEVYEQECGNPYAEAYNQQYDCGSSGHETYSLTANSGPCTMMLFGCVLFPLSLASLAWNEKQYACDNIVIFKAESTAITGECDNSRAVEGEFAFYSCPINESAVQPFSPAKSFNLPGLEDFLKVRSVAVAQNIEMFQCIETKEKIDQRASNQRRRTGREHRGKMSVLQRSQEEANTTNEEEEDYDKPAVARSEYKYRMGWAGVHFDSQVFHASSKDIQTFGCPDFVYNGKVNHNPAAPDRGDGVPAELGEQIVRATSVVAGGYTFSDADELKQISADQMINLYGARDLFGLPSSTDNIVTKISKRTLAVHDGQPLYLSSCQGDRLGCLRISYRKSDVTHISVLGKVAGAGVVEPYALMEENWWGCGAKSFTKMYPEEMTFPDMIARMKEESRTRFWLVRGGGLVVAWLSLYCIFNPIAAVWRWIPIIGETIGALIGDIVEMFLCIISCGLGCGCGLLVIATVWLGIQIIIGGPLMGGAVVVLGVAMCAARYAIRDPRRMSKVRFAEQQPYGKQQYHAERDI
jgi:hypothetical protein